MVQSGQSCAGNILSMVSFLYDSKGPEQDLKGAGLGFVLHSIFFFLTLQYCIGFAIYQHESATGIHLFPILNPPPSLYHPSGSSQCTSPKHPVSCIEPGLATRFIYDIIHVSVPFSQIIPPSPSPTESKDCSIHQCLCLYGVLSCCYSII